MYNTYFILKEFSRSRSSEGTEAHYGGGGDAEGLWRLLLLSVVDHIQGKVRIAVLYPLGNVPTKGTVQRLGFTGIILDLDNLFRMWI